MTDVFGNILKVGDTVCYIDYKTNKAGWVTGVSLRKGVVTQLFNSMVQIDNSFRRKSANIVKVV